MLSKWLKVTSDDLVAVWLNKHNSEADELFCYFYAKEVTEEQYKKIERDQLNAVEWVRDIAIYSFDFLFYS